MAQFLLSTHVVEGRRRAPVSDEAMQQTMERIGRLESDMKAAGAWVFSARLDTPGAARVVRSAGGEPVTTDGPFAETKEHVAGFYIIAADDLDAALGWAERVTAAIDNPIEVREITASAA